MHPKELEAESQRDTCPPMFLVAPFTTVQKAAKWVLRDEHIHKMWTLHIVEYDAALKKMELPIMLQHR